MSLVTPVIFLIFRRPDLTAQVFKQIRLARPQKLFIVADGPRDEKEALLCQQARAVTEQIDWDCEVFRNYSDVNLGCRERVSSGITWAFEHAEEAIILEDDCLPHPSFFSFCQLLLEEYRDNNLVMHIAGTNFLPQPFLRASYLFSRLVPIWGWATWRRAWQHFDIEMQLWPEYRLSRDIGYFGTQAENVKKIFQSIYLKEIDAWDGQWAFSCLVRKALTIIPKVNLVKNIGFREDATHTKAMHAYYSKIPLQEILLPLKKPSIIELNREFDRKFLDALNGGKPSVPERLFNKLLKSSHNYLEKLRFYK